MHGKIEMLEWVTTYNFQSKAPNWIHILFVLFVILGQTFCVEWYKKGKMGEEIAS